MVLELVISETNGAAATVTDGVANYNYGSQDAPNLVPASAPVNIHPTLTRYSFEKYQRFRCNIGTGGTLIDNMRFWMTGGAVAAYEALMINLVPDVRQNDAYATPVATQSTKADQAFPTTLPSRNVFSPTGASNDEITPADPYTDYIVWQAVILSTAAGALPGPVPQKSFRVQYDEQ